MITLEEAKVGMADKVAQTVIDEFRRSSLLLDSLKFDNAVSPGTGGSTLVYGYTRLKTPSTASFRAINTDYTPVEAVRDEASAKLKIFGGNFQLDRVIIDTAGVVNELNFQMRQKVMGATNLFHYTTINGDDTLNELEFEGLDKILTGTSTEIQGGIDISTAALMDSNSQEFIDMLDAFLAELEGTPTMLMGNSKLLTKIKGIARRAGYYTRSEDAFGRTVDNFGNIPLVDLRNYFDGTTSKPCVPIIGGNTDLYAIQIAEDGFHGVSPTGNSIISTHLPDLNAPGVMKLGDVEMVGAVVLKNSRKAGVLRNIKIGA